MLDFIWENLLSWGLSLVISSMDALSTTFLTLFSPNLVTMEHYFPFLSQAHPTILNISMGLALTIFTMKVVANLLGVLLDVYEPIMQLLIRLLLVLVGISLITHICIAMIGIADDIYWQIDAVDAPGSTYFSLGFWGGLFDNVKDDFINDPNFHNTSSGFLGGFVSGCLVIALGWNYFKLILELAKRYVVAGFGFYTSPLALATAASKSTSPIFSSWCKLFGSQLALLVFNMWTIKTFTLSIQAVSPTVVVEVHGHRVNGIFVYLVVYFAFLKLALELDAYLRLMGLTVSQGGAALGNTIGSVLRTVAFTVGGGLLKGKAITGNTVGKSAALGSVASGSSRAEVVKQQAAFSNLSGIKDGEGISNTGLFKNLNASQANEIIEAKNFSVTGDDGIEVAKKSLPEVLENKDVVDASVDKNGINASYKDKDGNIQSVAWMKTAPDGISQEYTSAAGVTGYLKKPEQKLHSTAYSDNKSTYNDLAKQHLGTDNTVSKMTHPDILKGATVSQVDSDTLALKNGENLVGTIKYVNDVDDISGLQAHEAIGVDLEGNIYKYTPELNGMNSDVYNSSNSSEVNESSFDVGKKESNYGFSYEHQNVPEQKDVVIPDGASADVSPVPENQRINSGAAPFDQTNSNLNTKTNGNMEPNETNRNRESEEIPNNSSKQATADNHSVDSNLDDTRKSSPSKSYYDSKEGNFKPEFVAMDLGENVDQVLDAGYTFKGNQAVALGKSYFTDLKNANVVNGEINKDFARFTIDNGDSYTVRTFSNHPFENNGNYQKIDSPSKKTWTELARKERSRNSSENNRESEEGNRNPQPGERKKTKDSFYKQLREKRSKRKKDK